MHFFDAIRKQLPLIFAGGMLLISAVTLAEEAKPWGQINPKD
jgi:hypothetical protein